MACLTAGMGCGAGFGGRAAGSWSRGWWRCVGGQPGGEVPGAGSGPVRSEGGRNRGNFDSRLGGQPAEEGLGQPVEGDGVGLVEFPEQPVGEGEEPLEWRGAVGPGEWQGPGEPAAVGRQVPIPREAPEALEGGEVEVAVGEDLVGWEGAVHHPPIGVVADDGRAAQAFEDADLDFLGLEGEQAIESGAEALQRLPGQADDEVGVDVDTGVCAQEGEVLRGAHPILASADAAADLRVERLDADFELDGARGKPGDLLAERLRQAVGDHLEVEEQAFGPAVAEEAEDGAADLEVQVEGAVDELEVARPAIEQALHGVEEAVEGERPDGNLEGRQAELAGERTAAGGFDVEDPVGEVGVGVLVVRQCHLREVGQRGVEDVGGCG